MGRDGGTGAARDGSATFPPPLLLLLLLLVVCTAGGRGRCGAEVFVASVLSRDLLLHRQNLSSKRVKTAYEPQSVIDFQL